MVKSIKKNKTEKDVQGGGSSKNLMKRKKNRFVFESFRQKIKKINVRLHSNIENDMSFVDLFKKENVFDNEVKINDNESNFLLMITREKSSNATSDYSDFLIKVLPYCDGYVSVIKNSSILYSILYDELIKEIESSVTDKEKNKTDDEKDNDHPDESQRQKVKSSYRKKNIYQLSSKYISNHHLISSILELIVALIKDIRDSSLEINNKVLMNMLPLLIKIIKNSVQPEEINKIFSIMVNLIKFLYKFFSHHENFPIFYGFYRELLHDKTYYNRRFSIESIVFLFKNADIDEKCLFTIYESVFKNENHDQDHSSYISNDYDLLSKLVKTDFALSKEISELYSELILNNTKNKFSSLADRHLLKISLKSTRPFIEESLLIAETIIKIIKNNNGEVSDGISLYIYYIYSRVILYKGKTSILNENCSYNILKNKSYEGKFVIFYNILLWLYKQNESELCRLFHISFLIFIKEIVIVKRSMFQMEIFCYFEKVRNEFIKIGLISELNQLEKEEKVEKSIYNETLYMIFLINSSSQIKNTSLNDFIDVDYTTENIDKGNIVNLKNIDISDILINVNNYLLSKILYIFNKEYILLSKKILFTNSIQTENYFTKSSLFKESSYPNSSKTTGYDDENYSSDTSFSSSILKNLFSYMINSYSSQYTQREVKILEESLLISAIYNYIISTSFPSSDIENTSNSLINIYDHMQIYETLLKQRKDKENFNIIEILMSLSIIEHSNNITLIVDYMEYLMSIQINENRLNSVFIDNNYDDKETCLIKDIFYYKINVNGKVYFSNKHIIIKSIYFCLKRCVFLYKNKVSNESNNNKTESNLNFILNSDFHKKILIYITSSSNRNVPFILDILYLLNSILNLKETVHSLPEGKTIEYFVIEIISPLLTSPETSHRKKALNILYSLLTNEHQSEGLTSIYKELYVIFEKINSIEKSSLNTKEYVFSIEKLILIMETWYEIDLLNLKKKEERVSRQVFISKIIIFYFLIGMYFINLTKEVWPSIGKALSKLFSYIKKENSHENNFLYRKIISLYINFIGIIDRISSSEDLYKKYSHIMKDNYKEYSDIREFDSKVIGESNEVLLNDVVLRNYLNSSINVTNADDVFLNMSNKINIFLNGIASSFETLSILLNFNNESTKDNYNEVTSETTTIINNFINSSINYINKYAYAKLRVIHSNKPCSNNENEEIHVVIKNFLYEKTFNSSSSSNQRLLYSILTLFNKENQFKLTESEEFLKVIKRLLTYNKSLDIQKICIGILSLYIKNIENNKELLLKAASNHMVIQELLNISTIKNNKGMFLHESNDEEREVLDIITRLYFSKYFGIVDENNKKIKTKSLSSFVSLFIQFDENQIKILFNLIFELIFDEDENKVRCQGNMYDHQYLIENFIFLRIKTFLHILSINLKQLKLKFKPYKTEIISVLTEILIKNKSLSMKDSKDSLEIITEKMKILLQSNIYKNYEILDLNSILLYHKHIVKISKDIRKECLDLLPFVYNLLLDEDDLSFKLYIKNSIYSILTVYEPSIKQLSTEYNQIDETNKMVVYENSVYNYIFKFSLSSKLFFILSNLNTNQLDVVKEIINISKSLSINDELFIKSLSFIDNIISVKYKYIEHAEVIKKTNFESKYAEILEIPEEKSELNINQNMGLNLIDLSMLSSYYNKNTLENMIPYEYLTDILSLIIDLIKKRRISYNFKYQKTGLVLNLSLKVFYLLQKSSIDIIKSHCLEEKTYLLDKVLDDIRKFQLPDLLLLIDFFNSIIFKNERSFFKEHENEGVLFNILKTIHFIVCIISSSSSFSDNTNIINYVHIYKNLLFKVTEPNTRLTLIILINEFNFYTQSTIDLLFELNKQEDEVLSCLNSNSLFDSLYSNQINCNDKEILIYQLLFIILNSDYTIQTIVIQKINQVMRSLNDLEVIKNIFTFIFQAIDLCKSISSMRCLFLLFHILNQNDNENISSSSFIEDKLYKHKDFFEFPYDLLSNNNNIVYENENYSLIESLLHIKLNIRIEAYKKIDSLLSSYSLSHFSFVKILFPLIKLTFSPNSYSSSYSKDNDFNVYTDNKALKQISTLLNIILKRGFLLLNEDEQVSALLYFTYKVKFVTDETCIALLQKGLSSILEVVKINNEYSFNEAFKSEAIKVIEETYQKFELNKDVFNSNPEDSYMKLTEIKNEDSRLLTNICSRLSTIHKNKFPNHKNESENERQPAQVGKKLFQIIKNKVLPVIRESTIIKAKMNKNGGYYINNNTLKGYMMIIKSLHPHIFQQEIIKILYDLINNLKNKEFHIREKAREGIDIVIQSIGEYIIPIIINEIQHQLHSGYMKIVLSYTVYWIILKVKLSNKEEEVEKKIEEYIIFDSILINTIQLLIDDIFGDTSEDKEQYSSFSNKYPESKSSKPIEALGILAQNISKGSSLTLMLFSIWKNVTSKVELDSDSQQKLISLFNRLSNSIKSSTNIDFMTILEFSFGLVSLEYIKDLENKKSLKEGNLIIKGSKYMDIENYQPVDYKILEDNKYILQKGVNNYNRITEEEGSSLRTDKNKSIIKSELCSFGFELLTLIIKKNFTNEFDKEIIIDSLKISTFYIKNTMTDRLLNKCLRYIISLLKIIKSKEEETVNYIYNSIKPNSRMYVAVLLKTLPDCQDIELSQTILKSLSEIINRKLDFIELSDKQISVLLSYIKLNNSNKNLRIHCFSLVLSLLKNRIFHKDIFNLVELIVDKYIESTENNILEISTQIVIEFISSYIYDISIYISNLKDIQKKSAQSEIVSQWKERIVNILIVNSESEVVTFKLNSLKLLNFIIESNYKGNSQLETSLLEIIFYKMIFLFVDQQSTKEIKIQLECLYKNLLMKYDCKSIKFLISNLILKLKSKHEEFSLNMNLKSKLSLRAYLELFSVLCSIKQKDIMENPELLENIYEYIFSNSKSLKAGMINDGLAVSYKTESKKKGKENEKEFNLIFVLNEILYSENLRIEKYIQDFVEMNNESSEVIRINIPYFDITYYMLLCYESYFNLLSTDSDSYSVNISTNGNSNKKSLYENFNWKDDRLLFQLFKLLEHPNFQIKQVCLRILQKLFNILVQQRYSSNNIESINENSDKRIKQSHQMKKGKMINLLKNNNIINKDLVYREEVHGLSKFISEYNLLFRDKNLVEYILLNLNLIVIQPSINENILKIIYNLYEKLILSVIHIYSTDKDQDKFDLNEFIEELVSESLSYLNSKNEYASLISTRVFRIFSLFTNVDYDQYSKNLFSTIILFLIRVSNYDCLADNKDLFELIDCFQNKIGSEEYGMLVVKQRSQKKEGLLKSKRKKDEKKKKEV